MAHNAHIQKTPISFNGQLTGFPMGQHLHSALAGDHFALGVTSTAGRTAEMRPDEGTPSGSRSRTPHRGHPSPAASKPPRHRRPRTRHRRSASGTTRRPRRHRPPPHPDAEHLPAHTRARRVRRHPQHPEIHHRHRSATPDDLRTGGGPLSGQDQRQRAAERTESGADLADQATARAPQHGRAQPRPHTAAQHSPTLPHHRSPHSQRAPTMITTHHSPADPRAPHPTARPRVGRDAGSPGTGVTGSVAVPGYQRANLRQQRRGVFGGQPRRAPPAPPISDPTAG